jgi:antirestriction protein
MEAIKKVMKKICGDDEYVIADYELPFKISAYISLEDLELLTQVVTFSNHEKDAFVYFMKNCEYTISEAMKKVQKWDFSYISIDDYSFNENAALGENFVEQIYGNLQGLDRETLMRYFDFEAFGRDLMHDYRETPEGNFISSY